MPHRPREAYALTLRLDRRRHARSQKVDNPYARHSLDEPRPGLFDTRHPPRGRAPDRPRRNAPRGRRRGAPAARQGHGTRRAGCLQGTDPDGQGTTSRRAENQQANAQGLRQTARRRHTFWSDTTLLDTHHVPFQRHSDSYGIKAINPRHSLDPPGLHQETDYGIDAPPRADQRVGTEPNHIEIIEVEPLKTTLPNAVPAVPSRSSESRSRGTNTALASRRPRAAAARPAAALGWDQSSPLLPAPPREVGSKGIGTPALSPGRQSRHTAPHGQNEPGRPFRPRVAASSPWHSRASSAIQCQSGREARAAVRVSEPGGVQLTDWIRAEGDAEVAPHA